MGKMTKETFAASLAARKKNHALRRKLVTDFGGKLGDYYPSKIWATMRERGIPNNDVPAVLIPKGIDAFETLSAIPLDSPIFDKPAPRKYVRKKPAAPATTDNKAMARQLIEMALKLLGE